MMNCSSKKNSFSFRAGLMTVLMIVLCLLTACSKESRKKKELREQAISFMEQGSYSAAAARFDEALSYSSGDYGTVEIDILKYRAEAEYLAEQYGNAANTYAQLRRCDDDKPEYMNLEVICMVKAGESLTKAVELFNMSEDKDPGAAGNRETLYVLGTALSESGDPVNVETAIDMYERALNDENGETGELYNRIGLLVFNQGDVDSAVEWFQRGIEFTTAHPDVDDEEVMESLKYNIAVCYEHKQDYETAMELFREYEEQYGSDEDIDHEIAFLQSRIRD